MHKTKHWNANTARTVRRSIHDCKPERTPMGDILNDTLQWPGISSPSVKIHVLLLARNRHPGQKLLLYNCSLPLAMLIGFCEFDNENGTILTRTADEKGFKMWSTKDYKHLYTIQERQRVEEIKIQPGVLLEIFPIIERSMRWKLLEVQTGKARFAPPLTFAPPPPPRFNV